MAVPFRTALADSAGRFGFPDLAAEVYLLSAERTGYAAARYGQQRWNGAGTPIVLGADARFVAELRLHRLGAVTGEILDENQMGLSGITVTAYAAGRQPIRLAGTAVSDDRGVYRIAGLTPGRYYVRTTAHQLEDRRGLLPTYFGQTSRTQQARLVEVDLDSEAGGITIAPLAGKLGRISGKVLGGAAASLTLFTESGRREAAAGAAGEFTFDQLAPGEYEILAQAPGAHPLAGYARVSVSEGTTAVGVELGAPPILRVRVEASDSQPADPRSVHVVLKRRGLSQELPAPAVLASETATLLPGDYLVWVQTPPGFCVLSVRASQGGQTSGEFSAAPRQTIDLTVTVSSRPAGLRGKVEIAGGHAAIGAPVFLSAIEAELRFRVGGVRVARADENGRYEFQGLPPGQYRVLSSFQFQDPEEIDWTTLPTGTVVLEAGQDAALDLRVVGSE